MAVHLYREKYKYTYIPVILNIIFDTSITDRYTW